jgi:hypothetical protein
MIVLLIYCLSAFDPACEKSTIFITLFFFSFKALVLSEYRLHDCSFDLKVALAHSIPPAKNPIFFSEEFLDE